MFLFRLMETIQGFIWLFILAFMVKTAFVWGYKANDNPFLSPIVDSFLAEKKDDGDDESVIDWVKGWFD